MLFYRVKWSYVFNTCTELLRGGFCINPKISIRIKILLTVSRRSLASYQWHSLHLPSPIPLGDLWCARQRIDIPRYLFLRQSIRSLPKESVNFLFIRFSRRLAEFIRFALSTSSKPRIFSSKLLQKYRITEIQNNKRNRRSWHQLIV